MPSEARIHGGAGDPDPAHQSRPAGSGLAHAWGALDRDRRLAAIAAIALFVTMFLPWYQQNAVVTAAKNQPLISRNLNAFGVFSFVEAAVLLVAVAVLVLLYMRADGRRFQLPGGDGAVVLAAGLWSALLLILRLFDKPGITQHGVAANVGIQWGIFFALAAAGLLAYAGSRMRAGQRPEPPLLRRWPIDDRSIDDRQPRSPNPDPPRGEERDPDPPEQQPARARYPPRPPEQEPTVIVPRRTPAPAKPRSRGWTGVGGSAPGRSSSPSRTTPTYHCNDRARTPRTHKHAPTTRKLGGNRTELCLKTASLPSVLPPNPHLGRRGGGGPDRGGVPAGRVDGAGGLPGDAAGQAGARRGPRGRRQDRVGEGARALPGPRTRAAAVLRGPRRGEGAV